MKLLLDTHVFVWWDSGHAALSSAARAVVADKGNQIFVSAASVWEIAIKRRLGKLRFDGSAAAAIGANGFFEVSMTAADAEAAGGMEWAHTDPFDRLLVAQAKRVGAVLVTADEAVRTGSGVGVFWAA